MGRGGAISFSSSVAVIDLSVFDSNIVAIASSNSNVEESGGGALAMEVSTVTISRSQFISNAALGGGLGGAIRSIFSMLYCSACDFNGNTYVVFSCSETSVNIFVYYICTALFATVRGLVGLFHSRPRVK